MTVTKGKQITCDICGKTVFLKFIEKGYADGGYTTYDTYEEKPKGWGTLSYPNRRGYLEICDECSAYIEKTINDYIERKKGNEGLQAGR